MTMQALFQNAPRTATFKAAELAKGMYVNSISSTEHQFFPPKGILIQTNAQLSAVQAICEHAIVDLHLSTDEIFYYWQQHIPLQNSHSIQK